MTTIIVAAQFGGIDGAQVIIPHHSALKRSFEGRPFDGFPFPILDFILRVDGQLQSFHPSGAGNLKFSKKRQSVSVDIVITNADWMGRSTSEISAFVASAIMSSVDLLREKGGRRLAGTNWDSLRAVLQEFSAAYREEVATVSNTDVQA